MLQKIKYSAVALCCPVEGGPFVPLLNKDSFQEGVLMSVLHRRSTSLQARLEKGLMGSLMTVDGIVPV